ncbi:class I SAM-dependent methyltransferase [Aliiglaciecola sp. CAU 1673]|uniref:class I SAM-dependent methyltransferase n=1 Tax=Aliiglaciecola sp. CAU 1673 TaxID=3032595 RepID=UPI0023DC0F2D|nr:class I SAM-dependent methyltransferase [Aliiglaciecola sp. CAU 1673]MDF2179741.1 class I SAM-dependent methyltransferase [Aliiglaciecola sp. CAU 1673]
MFVAPEDRLTAEEEKRLYDLHVNHPGDEGYLRFLSRLVSPLQARLGDQSHGLDFGCGPCPVLAMELETHGHKVAYFDPFYFPDHRLLETQYDFITCTEAIEHFFAPGRVWQQWLAMLRPMGLLAIMTKRVISLERFQSWHYKNDPTHVCFFSENTFTWLAQSYDLTVSFPSADVVIFQKLA